MVKIKLSFDNKKPLVLPLKCHGIPISFRYDLFIHRKSVTEGIFFINNLIIKNFNLKEDDFKNINKFELIYDSLTFNIIFNKVEIFKYVEDEIVLIQLEIENIFKLYHEFLLFMKMITESRSPLILDCRYNTPPYCNLKCPYCSNGILNKKHRLDLNYESARYFIQTILDSVNNFYENEPKRHRFMGGETYMHWDKYLEVNKFSHTFKNNNVTGYLGITNGITNMDKLLKWIKEANKHKEYKIFELHFSNETLRLENNTKLINKELLDTWKNNVITFGKEFKNYDNINLCVEIFNKSIEETLEVIEFAKENNFKMYGVSHDQTIPNYNYVTSNGKEFNNRIFSKVDGIKRRDRKLVHGLTSRFSIIDIDTVSFEMKIIHDMKDNTHTSYNSLYHIF
jgi:hypothetical protein